MSLNREQIKQEVKAELIQSMMERFGHEKERKLTNYRQQNAYIQKGRMLFTGSSLMENFPITEYCLNEGLPIAYNRGIGGYTTDEFLAAIDTVLLDPQPAKLFINIGTNDMTDRIYGEKWMEHLCDNYEAILRIAREKLPDAEIFCMAYYPTNRHLPDQNEWQAAMLKDRTAENITACNARVKALAEKYGCRYIDVNRGLCDENGEQKEEYAIDGVHMYASAYRIVFENLKPYLQ